MSRSIKVQTNFAVGEINPELRGRIDIVQYESALERARNVIIKPQGIAERRPGMRYEHTIPSAATPESGVRLVPFSFSTTQTYMLLFVNNRMYVYKEGVLQTNINGSGNDYLVTTIASASLSSLYWTQSADTLLLFQEDLIPQQIVRGGSHTTWTISAITWDFTPLYLFTASETAPAATLTPDVTEGNVTLTASAGVFVAGDVGDQIYVDNGFGRVRITGFTSTTVVTGVTLVPFFDTSAIASAAWTLEGGWEDAWSASKGYPRTATFHEGRLIIGGSKSLPTTVWGSKVGEYFNFDKAASLDDEGLEATIDTDLVNAVTAIHSGRDLQIFTTGTEFILPQLDGAPLTPSNFIPKPSTRRGSEVGIRPQSTEGGTLFLQRGGKAIREFLFTDTQGSYIANDVSLLSSHLLQGPTNMAMRRGTNVDEGDLLLVVNGDDGTMAAFTILRTQNVIAPSLLSTEGSYLDVAVEDADTPLVYMVVEREINSSTVYYVELFDSNYTTDSAVQYSGGSLPGTTTMTGLTHLEAETIKVIADDAILTDELVDGSGEIVTDRVATTYIEAGLEYPTFTDALADGATKTTPLLRTMPVETHLKSGPIIGFKKRIVQASIILDDTQAITVNGEAVPFRRLDDMSLDSGIAFFTGTKRAGPFLGYDYEGQIEVTQDEPLFMTLLALEYKVSVGQ